MVSRSDVCLSSVHLVFGNWGRRLGFPHLHVLHGYHDFGRVGPWRRPGSLFPPEARQHGTGVVPARKRVRAVHGAVDALHHDRREHKKTHEAEYVELHGGGTTDLPRRQPTDASLQRCCLEFTVPLPTCAAPPALRTKIDVGLMPSHTPTRGSRGTFWPMSVDFPKHSGTNSIGSTQSQTQTHRAATTHRDHSGDNDASRDGPAKSIGQGKLGERAVERRAAPLKRRRHFYIEALPRHLFLQRHQGQC